MTVRLRPARPDDAAFLYDLHRAALREHVERVFGPWDEREQARRFLAAYAPADSRVIEVDGAPVGRLCVQPDDDGGLYLANLALLPAWQGRGIGATVLRDLLAEADAAGRAVTLRVLRGNRALSLYTRFGFEATAEDATHTYLRRGPGS